MLVRSATHLERGTQVDAHGRPLGLAERSGSGCQPVSCTQRMPAGLPSGMPGMGDEIEGSTQHAPQPMRQSMLFCIGRQFAFLLPDENQRL